MRCSCCLILKNQPGSAVHQLFMLGKQPTAERETLANANTHTNCCGQVGRTAL
jgi:hypothetical protein